MDNSTFISIINSQSILADQYKIQKKAQRNEYNRLVRLKLQAKKLLNPKNKRKYHKIAPYFSRNVNIN